MFEFDRPTREVFFKALDLAAAPETISRLRGLVNECATDGTPFDVPERALSEFGDGTEDQAAAVRAVVAWFHGTEAEEALAKAAGVIGYSTEYAREVIARLAVWDEPDALDLPALLELPGDHWVRVDDARAEEFDQAAELQEEKAGAHARRAATLRKRLGQLRLEIDPRDPFWWRGRKNG